jgi:hypothetical protein
MPLPRMKDLLIWQVFFYLHRTNWGCEGQESHHEWTCGTISAKLQKNGASEKACFWNLGQILVDLNLAHAPFFCNLADLLRRTRKTRFTQNPRKK